ncbi:MAG: NHL repeat-containing protein, partial [Thermoanaerobaculia bacterium]|nr:NHL repeat-containing protein [Thermoanaerobaculia bacterium]
ASVGAVLSGGPAGGRELAAIEQTTRFGYAVVVTVSSTLLVIWWLRRHRGSPQRVPLVALGVVLALAVFTARASWRLSFRDERAELLYYAHGGADVKAALAEIDDLARRAGREVRIAYDADSAWPLTWYLRHRREASFLAPVPALDMEDPPIVLAGPGSRDVLWPFLGRDYARRELTLLAWPLERLTKFGLTDLASSVVDPAVRRAAWSYVVDRELPESRQDRWPNRRDLLVYVPGDLLADAWQLEPTSLGPRDRPVSERLEEVRVEPLRVLEGPYADVALSMPTQLAVTDDGLRIIADAGNDRVVLVTEEGDLVGIVGSGCEAASPCEADLEEPWGAGALPSGEIAVADTWNGSIRLFDRSGRQLLGFGELVIDTAAPRLDQLYGPRSVVHHPPTGRLLIADTGHHRLIAFDEAADPLSIGGPGVLEGYFQEPVGLAVDPADGSVLVADTWNRRIQRLGPDLKPIAAWPVPAWAGRSAMNKPFLAVDDRRRVYASDPEAARVLVFEAGGEPLGALVAAGWRGATPSVPLGLAVDRSRQELLVADAGLGRVWVLPLWR